MQVVADGKLMVPIQFGLQANGSTDLTIDVTPNLANVSQGVVLTPVIDATAVEKGQNGTTTETVTTTESLPPSTSTVTTTRTVTIPTTVTTTVTVTYDDDSDRHVHHHASRPSPRLPLSHQPPPRLPQPPRLSLYLRSRLRCTTTSTVTSTVTTTVTTTVTITTTSTKSEWRVRVYCLESIRNFSPGVMDGAYPRAGDPVGRRRHCPRPAKIPTKRSLI